MDIEQARHRFEAMSDLELGTVLELDRGSYDTAALKLAEAIAQSRGGSAVGILEDTRRRISHVIHHLQIQVDVTDEWVQWTFPPAHSDDDYTFHASFAKGLDNLEVGASLRGEDRSTFWYFPFEIHDFRNREEMAGLFQETLLTLLTRDTRILQTKGRLFWEFACEYQEGGTWTLLYSYGATRGLFPVPRIPGKSHVYRARAHEPLPRSTQ